MSDVTPPATPTAPPVAPTAPPAAPTAPPAASTAPPAAPEPGALPPVNVQPIAYPAGDRALTTPWNGLAIASLVLSVVGLSLIAVILGHIALSQIKRTGEQGSILALIGVILGYIGILVAIVLSILAIVMLASGVWFYTAVQ
jgi:peptidyl-prolyl cis-trans isomerase B (cyclophilin B)